MEFDRLGAGDGRLDYTDVFQSQLLMSLVEESLNDARVLPRQDLRVDSGIQEIGQRILETVRGER